MLREGCERGRESRGEKEGRKEGRKDRRELGMKSLGKVGRIELDREAMEGREDDGARRGE